jgi:hypothetical protein
MVRNASKITGKDKAEEMLHSGLLGEKADRSGKASITHYTTVYRQDIVFSEMKKIVLDYFNLWYI